MPNEISKESGFVCALLAVRFLVIYLFFWEFDKKTMPSKKMDVPVKFEFHWSVVNFHPKNETNRWTVRNLPYPFLLGTDLAYKVLIVADSTERWSIFNL